MGFVGATYAAAIMAGAKYCSNEYDWFIHQSTRGTALLGHPRKIFDPNRRNVENIYDSKFRMPLNIFERPLYRPRRTFGPDS